MGSRSIYKQVMLSVHGNIVGYDRTGLYSYSYIWPHQLHGEINDAITKKKKHFYFSKINKIKVYISLIPLVYIYIYIYIATC